MKANEAKLLDFLKKAPQMVIPIFQRTYSWSDKQCEQLWNDIVRCGTSDHIDVHFVGSIVHVADGLSGVTQQVPLLIIDGQQRLTTVSLLLAAMAQAVQGEPSDGLSKKKINYYYLMDQLGDDMSRYKLILSKTDRDTLISIIDDLPRPEVQSVRISENYKFFQNKLGENTEILLRIWRGLQKLMVVEVALERGKDNPQLIFESMNSTGKELSQADLIRNYVLMGLDPSFQVRMYDGYWFKIEQKFGQEAYEMYFDGFMRYYLTIKTGRLVREYEVYDVYKDYSREQKNNQSESAHTEKLLHDLYHFADIYCCIALGKESDPKLKAAFDDIQELRADVVFPFLMEVYHDVHENRLTSADQLKITRLVESYVFRRAVVGLATASMNRTFAVFAKSVDKNAYLESVQAQFMMLTGYRNFPRDEEFFRAFQTRDLYNSPRRSYFLRRLENYQREEPIYVSNYTIEHIMPQNPELSIEWRNVLGADWKQLHLQYLHTLGNLTLTAYNSTYSDRPFSEKRDMPTDPEKGLAKSPLHLNEGIGHTLIWDEAAIRERAEKLASRGLLVWSAPEISSEVIQKYAKKRQKNEYSIEQFSIIHVGKMKYFYEEFRIAVMALDPVITEEFLKYYVAYKAETNIVDLIPMANQLKLAINMRFADIDDPRGMCIDISGVSHWGNGQIEVILKHIDDLPYIIGLVRQSLDAQLGGQE